jgi:hypothetical protein
MTNFFQTLAAAAILFIGLSAPAAAGDYVSLGQVGDWNVYASHELCISSKDFTNDTELSFGIFTDGQAVVQVGNTQWNIPKVTFTVVSSIDRTKPVTLNAVGEGMFVTWNWQLDVDEINLMSNGMVLFAKIGAAEYSYRLDGSAAMFQALVRCAVERTS